jgi:acetyl-CoA acetyltransferase
MKEAVILSAVRVPTGRFLGTLKGFPAPRLGALVVKEAVRRAGVDPDAVDEVIRRRSTRGCRRRWRRSRSTRCAGRA